MIIIIKLLIWVIGVCLWKVIHWYCWRVIISWEVFNLIIFLLNLSISNHNTEQEENHKEQTNGNDNQNLSDFSKRRHQTNTHSLIETVNFCRKEKTINILKDTLRVSPVGSLVNDFDGGVQEGRQSLIESKHAIGIASDIPSFKIKIGNGGSGNLIFFSDPILNSRKLGLKRRAPSRRRARVARCLVVPLFDIIEGRGAQRRELLPHVNWDAHVRAEVRVPEVKLGLQHVLPCWAVARRDNPPVVRTPRACVYRGQKGTQVADLLYALEGSRICLDCGHLLLVVVNENFRVVQLYDCIWVRHGLVSVPFQVIIHGADLPESLVVDERFQEIAIAVAAVRAVDARIERPARFYWVKSVVLYYWRVRLEPGFRVQNLVKNVARLDK